MTVVVRLPSPPRAVEAVAAAVLAVGGRAYAVGGCVRDAAMGHALKDWDIEVHGIDVDTLEQALRRVGRVSAVGRSFAVLKVKAHGLELDVSLPRRDSKAGPGHRGIAVVADPHLGLREATRRRDLTVNAMMVDLHDGTLHDPWGGLNDLDARVLRAVDAGTFLEDPLRALRAIQFLARLGFAPHDSLLRLCAEAALDELAPERVWGEWVKALGRGRHLSSALRAAVHANVHQRTLGVPPPASLDAWADLVEAAASQRDSLEPEGRQLAWMCLAWLTPYDVAEAAAIMDRLGVHTWLGYKLRDSVLAALAERETPLNSDAALRWLSTRAEVGLVTAWRALLGDAQAAEARARAEALGVLWAPPHPLVLGRDAIALGALPGRAMGEALDAVRSAQLDGEVRDAEGARALLAAILRPSAPARAD